MKRVSCKECFSKESLKRQVSMEKPGLDGRRGSQMGLLSREAVGIRTESDDDGKSLLCQICPLLPTVTYLGTVQ